MRKTKKLYSIKDYILEVFAYLLVYFKSIKPTKHYKENHEQDVPWHEAIEIILKTKNPRKKGTNYEIETSRHYLLLKIKNNTLYVVNAKRKK
jgi:hypothetical protein